MFKNAFVSVSHKEGLIDFIQPLAKKGMRIVSTGGTAKYLKKAGLSVIEVNQQTGFEEVMDGRIKSIHPHIYIPLLARLNNPKDNTLLKEKGIDPFDLVVCNLYPFEEKSQSGEINLVEWIDVGGPSLLRAAAKNFEWVTVVCDPGDYPSILKQKPNLATRKKLAGKVFSLLANYNRSIAHWMNDPKDKTLTKTPEVDHKNLLLKGVFLKQLLHGENPDQKADWFQIEKTGLHQASLLQGKDLSFNNICDLNVGVLLMREFQDPCCVAIKHGNPCGLACDNHIDKAINKALKADPVSVFGAVVAINRPVNEKDASHLCSLFLAAVIAPDYTESALKMLKSKKKNLRVLKWPNLMKQKNNIKIHSIDGSLLVQNNQKISNPTDWQYLGEKPNPSYQLLLLMAWKVCAHMKSNAIALVSDKHTVGLGMGQVNRVSSVEIAIQRWKNFHPGISSPVMASDGFFPFPDSIELAAKSGIKWIVQPGGSIKDKEVLAKAQNLSINMVLTGQRCFSH